MGGSGIDFLMEVTDRTKADVKGGTLIHYEDTVKLLEACHGGAQPACWQRRSLVVRVHR